MGLARASTLIVRLISSIIVALFTQRVRGPKTAATGLGGGFMRCPKCKSNMQVVEYEGVRVDRCMDCSGLWFDSLEHERLRTVEGSEAIDIGNRKVGRKYNAIGSIACPVCEQPLTKMVDREQQHLWYEACPSCRGVFFDAGEFRDYKEKTILDFFRSMLTKERV